MLSKLMRKFRPKAKPRFQTISDLDLITHSKTQVPICRSIRLMVDFYMN
jgi:hypothetical protein